MQKCEASELGASLLRTDAYLLLGRYDEAQPLLERLLTLQNEVGLLSEEYDLVERRLYGNFPQASARC